MDRCARLAHANVNKIISRRKNNMQQQQQKFTGGIMLVYSIDIPIVIECSRAHIFFQK